MGTDGRDVRLGGRAARAAGQQVARNRRSEGGFQSFFLVSIGKKRKFFFRSSPYP